MEEIILTGESKDIVSENISKLKEIFPDVFTEGNVDFDKLKSNLGEYVDDSHEKYSFTWPGKIKAIRESQKQSTGTLRPYKEESRNWNTTNNLYIEGDNLEVLKLLQKGYSNKIKCIYIDPPYNTGNDFIYSDDYSDNLNHYLKISGQTSDSENDSSNILLTSNPESHGRYHSNWLNMMYPRLKLARNLLKEDGVIFVHIDDNEVSNLKKLLDEIFGENCFVNIITIKTKVAGVSGSHLGKSLQNNAEYILIYSKTETEFQIDYIPKDKKELYSFIKDMELNNKSWKYTSVIKNEGEKEYVKSILTGNNDEIKVYKHSNYEFESINKIAKNEFEGNLKEAYYKYINKIFRTTNAQSSIRKRIMDETKDIDSDLISIEYIPTKGKNEGKLTSLFYKDKKRNLIAFLREVVSQEDDVIYKLDNKGNIWSDINYNNLKNEAGLSFPNGQKPIQLINYLIDMFDLENEIVLDFFSGSASTAHSVMTHNMKNDVNCNFIMIQIPEEISQKDKLYSEGFTNICEVGKERIRLVGDKIIEESDNNNLDIGFKVFKLDSSNLEKWDPDNKKIKESLIIDNIKPDRTKDDLIYEIMLKYGMDLTWPIQKENNIYSVGYGALIVCLEDSITKENTSEITNQMIKLINDSSISRVVFKDSSFGGKDSVKTNIKEIFSNYGVEKFITI